MNQQQLIQTLHHPEAKFRLQAAQIILMVEEVAALPTLVERYRVETDMGVKTAIAQTGVHLQALKRTGYDTLDAIFEHFRINQEIANQADAREADLMRQLESNLQVQLMKEQRDAANKRLATNAAIIAGATLLGGVSGALSSASLVSTPATDTLSSSLDQQRPQVGKERIPAIKPSATDVRVHLRRLVETTEPQRRKVLINDLASINNPAALPHLAALFINDPDAGVREAAQKAGKQIYWNAIYWEMTQNGSFDAEYRRRSALLGKKPPTSQPTASPPPAQEASQEAIGDILRKAQERREKRNKNRP